MYYDAIEEIEDSINDPNNMVGEEHVATIRNISDADDFCSKYNHDNNYKGLKVGQYIQLIGDLGGTDTYIIAGFDLEHNRYASDGSLYDNGYGIFLISREWLNQGNWRNSSGAGAFIDSKARSRTDYATNNLKYYLGNHLVERNVLYSSSVDQNTGKPTGYTWTKDYITTASINQIMGTSNLDDGEANYRFPLTKLAPSKILFTQGPCYSRNIYGIDSGNFKIWRYYLSSFEFITSIENAYNGDIPVTNGHTYHNILCIR